MAKKLTIKVGSQIHVSDTENILFEVVDSNKGHYKVEWSKIPSRRGKRPAKTIKKMFWTTSKKFKEQMKKFKGIVVTSATVKKYFKDGI